MRPVLEVTPRRTLRRRAVALGLLAWVALAGCNEGDSLEAIRQQQAAGDHQGSVEPLRQMLATHPDDTEVNFLYGRALAYTQPNLAGWSLRKAMKDPEWFVPAATQLALLALAAQDFNEVVKITGPILQREPENLRVLMMRANAYAHSKKDPELALADARRMLEIDPNATEAYEPLILALLGLDRMEEASESLAEAGRLLVQAEADGGLLAWHCATTAAFQQESGDIELARETWVACLAAHPTDLDVVSSAISFYDSQGEQGRSLEILRAAVATDSTSGFFRTQLAQRLLASGEGAQAEALLREATSSSEPRRAAAAWIELARLRQALGEYGSAADAFDEAVGLARETGQLSPQLLFEHADALLLADRLELALEASEELSVPAHRQLIRGRVAQERRDPAAALEQFDEALRLWPDNPWARYYAALAAEELGDFGRALEDFRNSVRIDPAATDARTRGAALLLAEGDPSSALNMLQTALDKAPLEIEGQLLAMRASGLLGATTSVADYLAMIEAGHPQWAGHALAEAAEGLARRSAPALAVDMLRKAPGTDFNDPRYATGLRALIRFSHAAGEPASARDSFRTILAAHPDSGTFQEILGLDLELSGAPAEAAYARAVELEPGNARALAGLGRLAARDDPDAAREFFRRAASADPTNPAPKLELARALIAGGHPELAAEQLDALLVQHPFQAEAAAERARLDLDRGIATSGTLERSRRAARFGGTAEALELLQRVHLKRGETELAERAGERLRSLREVQATEDS